MAYYLLDKQKDEVTGYSTLPLLVDENPNIGTSSGYVKELFIAWFSKAVGNTKWESACKRYKIFEGELVKRKRKNK